MTYLCPNRCVVTPKDLLSYSFQELTIYDSLLHPLGPSFPSLHHLSIQHAHLSKYTICHTDSLHEPVIDPFTRPVDIIMEFSYQILVVLGLST